MSEIEEAVAVGMSSFPGIYYVPQVSHDPIYDKLASAALEAALPLFVAAIDAVEIGAGSEHYRHGRETMRDDAISAIQDLLSAQERL